MKKLIFTLLFLCFSFLLISCGSDIKIKFETNGGEPMNTIVVEKDEEFKVTEPIREGYRFIGWYLDSDFKTEFNGIARRDITLYAKWELIEEEIFIKFFEDISEPILVDETTYEKIMLVNTEKEGYIFSGWFINSELTIPLTEDIVKELKSSIIIYPKWEIISEDLVLIKFDIDGTLTTKTIEKDSTIEIPEEPTKEGHTFIGWYLNDELYDFSNIVNNEITLVAKFEKNEYTVILLGKNEVEITIKKYYGDVLVITDIPNLDCIVGYKYEGVFFNEKYTEICEELVVTEEITLYIKYTPYVTINSLTGEVVEVIENVTPSNVKKLSMKLVRTSETNEDDVIEGEDDTELGEDIPENEESVNPETPIDPEPIIPAGQYIVMYKSETNIKFTIKLNNPKGESIDAIQLTCDDPNSKILVDGNFVNIQFDENGTRIINWAQEDPYQKTFYIQTTSEDDINTIRVVDIKVNGVWQEKGLENDELKVYKMNDEDLKWSFVRNTRTEYVWKFETTERISNVVVRFKDENLIDVNGEYKITENGTVEYEYDFTYEGVTLRWTETREIELLKLDYTENHTELGIIYNVTAGTTVQLGFWIIEGTDVDKRNIKVIYYEKEYNFYLFYNDLANYGIMRFPLAAFPSQGLSPNGSMPKDAIENTRINIGGMEYTVEDIFGDLMELLK